MRDPLGNPVRWEAVHSHVVSAVTLADQSLRQGRAGRGCMGFAVSNRRLTHYEKRVAALISRETARRLKSLLQRRLSDRTLLLGDSFDECLAELASMSGEQPRSMVDSKVGQMIASSVRGAIISQLNAPRSVPNEVAALVCESLSDKATLLDAEFRLPPVRRGASSEESEKPATLIQRRARVAHSKMRAWKRKFSLARTKLAIYRKKVNYYKKKGEL